MTYKNNEAKKASRLKWKREHPDRHKAQVDRYNRSRTRQSRIDFLYGQGAFKHQQTQLEIQGNRCSICEEPLSSPHFDHNHLTGQWRGALCRACNQALGLFGESVARLQKAIIYLQSWDK